MSRVGAVIIGRNEARKLPRCLASVVDHASPVVYVDSGSTDASADIAREGGVEVLVLDASTPFTVARARNAGFERLCEIDPSLEWVQFVDGDSAIVPSWLECGRRALTAEAGVAAVFGRWRERRPRSSICARVYEMDGDPRLSPGDACPGMSMMRVGAFRQAGGFEPALQALEDHELSLRLRRLGWRILRLDAEMAVHDTGVNDWRTWWRRHVRGGHALGYAAALHGRSPERFAVRRSLSIGFWAVLLPTAVAAGVGTAGAVGLVPLACYPAFIARIYRRLRRLGFEREDAAAYAALGCGAKFPQAVGQARFHWERFRRRREPGILPDPPRSSVEWGRHE